MITHRKGNVLDVKGNADINIIYHIVNDQGGWGKGFSGQLGTRFPQAEKYYRDWYNVGKSAQRPFALGELLVVPTQANKLFIAHALAQKGYKSERNPCPFQMNAFIKTLEALRARLDFAKLASVAIHMPRVGAGLGGGNWDDIEAQIADILGAYDVNIYTL